MQRLDLLLSKKLNISRSHAKNLILKELVLVNNIIIKDPKKTFFSQDKIKVKKNPNHINVVYENQDFIIVYKPINLSVCRTLTTPKAESVLNEQINCELSGAYKPEEFGLPYRIDKSTEGLILMSKNNHSYFKYFNKKNLVSKLYLAFYEDILNISQVNDRIFQTNYFVCPHKNHVFSIFPECFCEINNYSRIEMPIFADNHALYSATLCQKLNGFFLCVLNSEHTTGRTHQIRYTLANLGYTIYGDFVYGSYTKNQRIQLFSVGLSIHSDLLI